VAFATFDSVPAKVAMNVAEKAADEGAAKGTAQGAAAKGEGIAKSAAADGGLGGAEKQAENHAPGAGGRMTPPQAAMMMRSGAPADGAFGSDRGKGAGGAAPPGTGRSDAMAPAAANRALGGGVQEAASPPLPKPLWRPLLVADRDGRASLSFTMPQSGGSFRVLIEAHGKGRVGATTLKLTPK
jgi:hypothetical protein